MNIRKKVATEKNNNLKNTTMSEQMILTVQKRVNEMIDVNDLIKGETYISPNTGDKFIFNRYYVTDKNIFAVDIYGTIHIAQKFRKEN
jgi:hypothetical protein